MSQFCLPNIWLILYKQSLVANLIRSGWGPCATLETSSKLINTIVTKLQLPEVNKENIIINIVSEFQKNSFKPVEHMYSRNQVLSMV